MAEGTFRLDGEEYDIDDFELGELEWLEEFVGKPLVDMENFNSIKAATGLLYLIRRKKDPAVTIEQVRSMKAAALFTSDEPAKKAAAKRPPKPAAP